MGATFQGKRVYPDSHGHLWLKETEYGLWPMDQNWYGIAPGGYHGNFSGHEVTEHEDGTITVYPSILINDGQGGGWHGYLERGVWREC